MLCALVALPTLRPTHKHTQHPPSERHNLLKGSLAKPTPFLSGSDSTLIIPTLLGSVEQMIETRALQA